MQLQPTQNWIETGSWGTFPDWLAAVGTVAALLWAISLSAQDLWARGRHDADSFGAWVSVYQQEGYPGLEGLTGESHSQLNVSAYNSGTRPVVYSMIRVADRRKPYEFTNYRPFMNIAHGVLLPSKSSDHEVVHGSYGSNYNVFVEFKDASNKVWIRDLRKSRYLWRWERTVLRLLAGDKIAKMRKELDLS